MTVSDRLKQIKEHLKMAGKGQGTYKSDVKYLLTRVEALEKALERYADHDVFCPRITLSGPCKCGLESALKEGGK